MSWVTVWQSPTFKGSWIRANEAYHQTDRTSQCSLASAAMCSYSHKADDFNKRAELAFPKSAGSFQFTGSSGGHGLAPAILSHSCDLKQCSHALPSEPISEPCESNPLLSYHISSLSKITLRLMETQKNLASWQLHYMQKNLIGNRTFWPVPHTWSLLTSVYLKKWINQIQE